MFYRCPNKFCWECVGKPDIRGWTGHPQDREMPYCSENPETCGKCRHPDAWAEGKTIPEPNYRETLIGKGAENETVNATV